MNYRHIYHAGCFADVFKHVLLIELLRHLLKKEKGFCYIDTHAGIGRYDLQSAESQKTREFVGGVEKILLLTQDPVPKAIQDYIRVVTANDYPHFYPGSPCIARHFLRAQDKMILSELHPQDVTQLKQVFKHDKQVAVHQLDAYLTLKAFLPPQERRGLVLIDPPFEKKNEVEEIISGLEQALKRWPTGVYAVWYPIKDDYIKKKLYHALKMLAPDSVLFSELMINPNYTPNTLNGCGMAILNPPWQVGNNFREILKRLTPALANNGKAHFSIFS